MDNEEEAQKAITELNGQRLKDAQLVNKSEPKPEGERRSFAIIVQAVIVVVVTVTG
jgi:hypothetical protein